jgi:hypothetical protein
MRFFPTQCSYVFHILIIFLDEIAIVSQNNIKRLVFVMEMQCVFCTIGTEFLNINWWTSGFIVFIIQ